MKKIFCLIILLTNSIFPQVFIYPDTLKYEMGQITVSATRYPENIIEIPYAVTLINEKSLMNLRGYGLDEILSSVPGVLAQTRAGNQDIRLIIRGFGARGAGDRSNYGTTRGIRIMVDGIPETEPDGRTSFDLIDLGAMDNMEIVRSNASAIWGNASGGIINLSTIPSSNNSHLSIKGLSGSFGFYGLQAKAVSPISFGKIYATLTNTNFAGWREHSSSYRTLFNFGFTSNLSDITKINVLVLAGSNLFHIPGPLTKKQYDLNPQQANSTYAQRDERRDNKLGRIGFTIEHNFDEENQISGMLFASPKFLQRSERGTFRDFTRYHVGGNIMFKNNSKLSDEIENYLIFGMDEAYQDGAILFYSLSSTNHRGSILRTNKREGANNFGAFIQDEIIIDDKISFIAGLRYDNITYYSEDFLVSSFGLQSKSFSKITPKFGLTYRFNQTQSVYANIGGGIEVPAGNETDPSSTYGQDQIYLLNPLLEPIISTTYEIGTKHLLAISNSNFLKTASVDFAGYYIDIKNDIIPYRGGRFYFTAGKTYRVGIELGTELEFDNGISLKGAFTFSDNKYNQYLVDSVHYNKPNSFADYKNNEVAGIPGLFYNLGLTLQPKFLKDFFLNISINSVSSYFVDDANKIEVPSYAILNTTIGINNFINISEHLKVRGFITINNLFNTKYVASAFINPDIVKNEAIYLEPGLPRNFVLSASLIFE
jgi:iron complex outermembrane receptor protein